MYCHLLTTTTLASGISKFLSSKTKWRADFHNRFYSTVTDKVMVARSVSGPSAGGYYAAGSKGPTLWDDIIAELGFWKALRGAGALKASLASNGHIPNGLLLSFPSPSSQSIAPYSLSGALGSLFITALSLKPAKNGSPVFASKLCHMLCPSEFPIYDGKFIGRSTHARFNMLKSLSGWSSISPAIASALQTGLSIPQNQPLSYDIYRTFVLSAWDTLPTSKQSVLKLALDKAIIAGGFKNPIWAHYPYRTKIPELCLF